MFKKKKNKPVTESEFKPKEEKLDVSSKDIAKALDKTDNITPSWQKKEIKEQEKLKHQKIEKPVIKEQKVEIEQKVEKESNVEKEPKGASSISGFFSSKIEVKKNSTKDVAKEPVKEEKKTKKGRKNRKQKEENEEIIIQEFTPEPTDEVVEKGFNWANSEDYEAKVLKESKKKKNKKKGKKDEIEEPEEKHDLNKFFLESRKQNEKLLVQDKKGKKNKKDKKGKKGKKKRKNSKHQRYLEDVKNQRIFRFRKKKYTKVEDFIKFLNDNYLDIDIISREILDNENFFGWVSKRSGVFDVSLKEFKEIKDEIENKS